MTKKIGIAFSVVIVIGLALAAATVWSSFRSDHKVQVRSTAQPVARAPRPDLVTQKAPPASGDPIPLVAGAVGTKDGPGRLITHNPAVFAALLAADAERVAARDATSTKRESSPAKDGREPQPDQERSRPDPEPDSMLPPKPGDVSAVPGAVPLPRVPQPILRSPLKPQMNPTMRRSRPDRNTDDHSSAGVQKSNG